MLMAVSPVGLGYDRPATLDFYRRAVRRVEEISGVRAATLASNLPLTPLGIRRTTMVEGREEGALIRINIVLPGYLEAVGIPLRQGRDFRPQDEESAPPVAIVNETMAARLWPGEAAVGRRFHWNRQEDRPLEVVGVAADSKYITMGEEPEPHIYLPLAQAFSGTMVLLVRTEGDPESLMAPIRRAVQGLDPRMPLVGVATISSVIDESLWASHLGAALLLGFGLLALALAGTGVYGMMSYSGAQRTHEIGIRAALGARPRNVVAMILRDGLWLVAAGVAAGLLAAVWGARLVAGLLYGVDPLDPTVYLSAGAVLIGVALWACYLPARHATRVDPMVALRSE
jgi:predicted permease